MSRLGTHTDCAFPLTGVAAPPVTAASSLEESVKSYCCMEADQAESFPWVCVPSPVY